MAEVDASPECYGTMFPDVSSISSAPTPGTVLSVSLTPHGTGAPRRELTVDKTAWQGCRACDSYHACYELSLAKTIVGASLRGK